MIVYYCVCFEIVMLIDVEKKLKMKRKVICVLNCLKVNDGFEINFLLVNVDIWGKMGVMCFLIDFNNYEVGVDKLMKMVMVLE